MRCAWADAPVVRCVPTALALIASALVLGGAPGCSAPDADDADDGAALEAELLPNAADERPWEVKLPSGATVLPNVFYAEPSENEQLMPFSPDGHVQIDRLVYPTLGNPNLFSRDAGDDVLTVVLRIEESALAHVVSSWSGTIAGSPLTKVSLGGDANNALAVYLVPRTARDGSTESAAALGAGTHAIRVRPAAVFANPITNDIPPALRARRTVRLAFRNAELASVPAGLYDVLSRC